MNEGTGLPAAKPGAGHVTGRRAAPTTLAKKLQASRERAKKVRSSAPRRIPVQISIDLEIHDAMVELAAKHGCKITDIHRRCLRDGLMRYIDLKPISAFEGSGFGVFDRVPRLAKGGAGPGEGASMTAIDNEVEEARRRRAQQAEELGLPGHRRDA